MDQLKRVFARKKLRILPKAAGYRFGLALLALLAACATPTSNEEVPAVQVQAPTSTEVAPTPTYTPEPTATPTEVIVESPVPGVQEWWDGLVADAAKYDCELTYELVNVRETGIVNLIPWTIDQHGETVTAILPVFCGTGSYMVFGVIGEDVSTDLADAERGRLGRHVVGPTHMMSAHEDLQIPQNLLGGLNAANADLLRQFYYCLGFTNMASFFASLAVPVDPKLVTKLTTRWGNFSDVSWQGCYDQYE
jgi:hypothetical protein